jgi:hypothetical protein
VLGARSLKNKNDRGEKDKEAKEGKEGEEGKEGKEAKKAKKIVPREYTKADLKELRAHSKAKTPVAKIVRLTKRTEGSLRQKSA